MRLRHGSDEEKRIHVPRHIHPCLPVVNNVGLKERDRKIAIVMWSRGYVLKGYHLVITLFCKDTVARLIK